MTDHIHSCWPECPRPACVQARADQSRMAAAGLVPIRIVEDRGCPGCVQFGRLAGLCICCELQGRGGEQMEPLGKRDAQRGMRCPNFRSTGAVHVTVDGGEVTVEG